MMTKKKRRLVLIIIIVLILVMLAATFLVLYLNTDMFKSNQTLFVKYIGKNADNLRALESIINETEYEGQLTTKPYNIDMEATVNYTQNIGTTEENANNGINQLKLTVEGQTDNNNGYTASMTSTDQAGMTNMTNNMWTWIIAGIALIAIGVMIWSLVRNSNTSDQYIDPDDRDL